MNQKKREYKPVRVYSTFDQAQLILARIALEKEGILYETINESFSAIYPSTPGMGTIDVLVDENDVERALKALEHLIKKEK